MADFSIFGEAALQAAGLSSEITGGWTDLMKRLEHAQRAFTAEEDLVIEILHALALGQKSALDEYSQDLYQMMVDKASELRQFLPCKTVAAFTKELKAKHSAIEAALTSPCTSRHTMPGQTRIRLVHKTSANETAPGNGDTGEDVLCNLGKNNQA